MADMETTPPDPDLAAIGLLQDPVRRALYRHVAGAGGEVSRNQAAEAVEQAGADLELQVAARRSGVEAGRREAASPLDRLLAARGYEPYEAEGVLRLRNCPFANLAGEYPVLVCAMNLSLIEGLLEGIGEPAGRAEMDPAPGRCCVAVRPTV
jgi:predicted ArsR family transcriptional regulator